MAQTNNGKPSGDCSAYSLPPPGKKDWLEPGEGETDASHAVQLVLAILAPCISLPKHRFCLLVPWQWVPSPSMQ